MTTTERRPALMPDQPHMRLGALIRRRYREQGLSMDTLAERAGLSRSTVHRVINAANVDVVPEPVNIAKVALAAGIGEDEVRETVDDVDFRNQIVVRMGSESVGTMRDYNRARAGTAPPRADLWIMSPDGVAGRVSFEAADEKLEAAVRQLGDILRSAHWVAAVPLSDG